MKFRGPYCVQISFTCGKHFSRKYWSNAAGEPSGVVGFGVRRDRGSESTLVLGGGRLVVTIGLRDTIVVDTPDALLVCAADRSQEVRAIAEELARAREEDT